MLVFLHLITFIPWKNVSKQLFQSQIHKVLGVSFVVATNQIKNELQNGA